MGGDTGSGAPRPIAVIIDLELIYKQALNIRRRIGFIRFLHTSSRSRDSGEMGLGSSFRPVQFRQDKGKNKGDGYHCHLQLNEFKAVEVYR